MRKSARLWRCACILVFSLLIDVNVTEPTTAMSEGNELYPGTNYFEFRPGVIVDTHRTRAYLMNPQRGIDAIDLLSGKPLWSTTKAAKPLLVYDDILIAQAESAASTNLLRIVALNTQDAGKLMFGTTVQLPHDVQVTIEDGLGITFHASARMQKSDVIISWKFSRQYISGPPPNPGAKARVTAGAARIDPETGNADSLKSEEVPPASEPRLPDKVARLVTEGKLSEKLRRIGNVLVAIVRSGGKDGKHTVLRRWHGETGEPLPDVVLFSGQLTYRYVSADGRHLLASRLLDSPRSVWEWRIFFLETGDQVAQVRNASPAAGFFITATSLIHEAPPTAQIINGRSVPDQPLRLRAIDLKTSDELWERPFRDTTYRGPYPPR